VAQIRGTSNQLPTGTRKRADRNAGVRDKLTRTSTPMTRLSGNDSIRDHQRICPGLRCRGSNPPMGPTDACSSSSWACVRHRNSCSFRSPPAQRSVLCSNGHSRTREWSVLEEGGELCNWVVSCRMPVRTARASGSFVGLRRTRTANKKGTEMCIFAPSNVRRNCR
jgi:hypothetical protein